MRPLTNGGVELSADEARLIEVLVSDFTETRLRDKGIDDATDIETVLELIHDYDRIAAIADNFRQLLRNKAPIADSKEANRDVGRYMVFHPHRLQRIRMSREFGGPLPPGEVYEVGDTLTLNVQAA